MKDNEVRWDPSDHKKNEKRAIMKKTSVSCLGSESVKHGARNDVQIIHNINRVE
jgi:hypothetical protein